MDQLGRQGPKLAAAQKECDRLRAVEADLSQTAEKLRAEITTMATQHKADLEAVVSAEDTLRVERDAAVAAREAMQAERDDALSKYEAMTLRHNEELTKAKRKAKRYYDGIKEIDSLLGGELSFFP